MTTEAATTVRDWVAEHEVSARSLLVTIFGDSLLPVTTSVWLSQLFELTEPFGFNQRLIRTSLFRLGSDAWVTSERVGRQSRYSLTPLAIRESTDADPRIYRSEQQDWDGSWTLVLVDAPIVSPGEREQITKYLRWHGFVALGRGVLASPTTSPKTVGTLLEDLELSALPVMAVGTLDDIDRLVTDGLFTSAFDMAEIETDYQRFLDRYRPVGGKKLHALAPVEAYAVRTMLIHDLRRVRLREPDIPRTLLPTDWIGQDAYRLAAELYAALSPAAARTLGDVLDVDYPPTMPGRFPA